MKVSKETLQEMLELYKPGQNTSDWAQYNNGNPYEVNFGLVQDELIDTSRWSHIHERIYKDLNTSKFYATTYSVGATECQMEEPYEYDGAEIEIDEVKPVEVIKIEYHAV